MQTVPEAGPYFQFVITGLEGKKRKKQRNKIPNGGVLRVEKQELFRALTRWAWPADRATILRFINNETT